MSDIIRLLPDSVANQIAAGEVIQRPASAVKELLENAVDSGADLIKVFIKDSGKSLIQVTDNGCGMSWTDARMCFERHSTSKIHSANDLFAIQTMGFRGEALASIAAIAELELKTRRMEDETGTEIIIRGSQLVSQEPVACSAGSNFSVKNLFFNVPARRKFLKSDGTEMKHIITEFQRVALANPEIEFILNHNDVEILSLPAANLRQRIVHLMGKSFNQQLLEINCQTSLARIRGFAGKPEFARKTLSEQFFFVNKRYMRHPFFHKAIMLAYERILPPETFPAYFIYFEVDTETIDINIHPTKTEIKFEHERALWQILHATVKESLGKFNIVPSIDFDMNQELDIPVTSKDQPVHIPDIKVDPDFNPFDEHHSHAPDGDRWLAGRKPEIPEDWEKLFTENDIRTGRRGPTGLLHHPSIPESGELPVSGHSPLSFFQLKNKYILTPVKSGLMLIDQKRAHERILYERFMNSSISQAGIAQQELYPEKIELNTAEYEILKEFIPQLSGMGFNIRDFGGNSIIVDGCPADLIHPQPAEIIELLLEQLQSTAKDPQLEAEERISAALAKTLSIDYGKVLSFPEMQSLVDELFAASSPNFTPDGKPVITIWSMEEIEKKFR